MRPRPLAILLLLALSSFVFAQSNAGATGLQSINTGDPGSFTASNFSFSCLFGSWQNIATNIILIGYLFVFLWKTYGENGLQMSLTTGGVGILIFALYIYYGGFCKYGWYIIPAIVLQTMTHKKMGEISATYQAVLPLVDAFLIIQIIKTPTIAKNPYSFFIFAIAPAILWYISRSIANWMAGRFGNADWKNLGKGYAAVFVKKLKQKLKGKKKLKKKEPKAKSGGWKKRIKSGVSKAAAKLGFAEQRLEAKEADEDVNIDNDLTVIAGRLAEVEVVDSQALGISSKEATVMNNMLLEFRNCLSGLCNISDSALKQIQSAAPEERDAKSREWLSSILSNLRERLGQLLNRENSDAAACLKADTRLAKVFQKKDKFMQELKTEEDALKNVEKQLRKTGKQELKDLEDELANKRRELLSKQASLAKAHAVYNGKRIGKALGAKLDTSHDQQTIQDLGEVSKSIKAEIEALEKGKAKIEEVVKKLNKWENIAIKFLTRARKEIKAINSFEKQEKKMLAELKKIDEGVAADIKEQGETLKKLEWYEKTLEASQQPPESLGLDIIAGFGEFFYPVEDISRAFAKAESEIYPPYLAEFRNVLIKTSNIIRINKYIVQLQKYHEQGWAELNSMAKTINEGGQAGGLAFEDEVAQFISTMEAEYTEDDSMFNVVSEKIKDNLQKLERFTANMKAGADETARDIETLAQERNRFLTDLQKSIMVLLKVKARNAEEFMQKTQEFASRMRRQEGKLKTNRRVAKVKDTSRKLFRGVNIFSRLKAGRQVKEEASAA